MHDALIHAVILGGAAGLMSRALLSWFFYGHIRAVVVGLLFRDRIKESQLVDPDVSVVDYTSRQINELLAALETPRWLCRLLSCQWCCSFHASTWSSVSVFAAYALIGCPAVTPSFEAFIGMYILIWAVSSGVAVSHLLNKN